MFPEHSISDCALWESWILDMYIRRAETPSAPGQSYTSIVITGSLSLSLSSLSSICRTSISHHIFRHALGHVLFSLVKAVHESKPQSLLLFGIV